MSSFFHQLGRKAGRKIHKAKWYYESLAGEEGESIRAEFEMGAFLAKDHQKDLDIVRNEVIDGVCVRLAERLYNENWQITPRVVVSQESQAYALPGGFIFITLPLLHLCEENEEELAFVLGHEIGHVIKRHAIRRVAASKTAAFFSRALATRAPATRMLAPYVGQLVDKGYSQELEFDADAFSQRLCKAAGYSPEAGVRLLARFLDAETDLGIISSYFSSHPPIKERMARMRGAMKSDQ